MSLVDPDLFQNRQDYFAAVQSIGRIYGMLKRSLLTEQPHQRYSYPMPTKRLSEACALFGTGHANDLQW